MLCSVVRPNCPPSVGRPRKIRIASFQYQLEAGEVGIGRPVCAAGAVRPGAQRLFENSEPARIVARPVDTSERHADDLGIAAARPAPQELLGQRVAADAVQTIRRFVREHLPRELRLAKESCRRRVRDPAVSLQQGDHRPVFFAVSRKHRVATRHDARIRIRAVLEQHLGHLVPAGGRTVLECHPPREGRFVSFGELDALVRVESEVQEEFQDLGLILGRCDPQ